MLITKWDKVSNRGYAIEHEDRIVKYFVYRINGLPDFSEPRFEYLSEKPLDRIAEVAKKQMTMLRQFHNIGENWGISLRLVKENMGIDLYLIFRYSGEKGLPLEEIQQLKQQFNSTFPKEYTFSSIEFEDVKNTIVFSPDFANESAEIFKTETEYCGDTPFIIQDGVRHEFPKYVEKFYSVPTWKAADNNMELICDSLMHASGNVVIDVCLNPTTYTADEQDWINVNLKRMREVINGQKIYNPGERSKPIWTGEPIPIIKIPQDNYEKMNKQYENSHMFLCSVRIFAESHADIIANALTVNSVRNESQIRISRKGFDAYDKVLRDFRSMNVSSTNTLYWIKKERDEESVTPYRAQRLNRLVSLEEASNFFRIPIPKKAGFPGFNLDTGLRDFSTRRAIKKKIELGNYLDDSSGVDLPASLDVQQFAKHGLIVGVPGSGKTTAMFNILYQLWEHKIPFIVLEPAKTEYRALKTLKGMEDILVFTCGDEAVSPFRFNPLEVLPGIKLERHISNLQSCFVGAFDLFDPLPIFLEQAIKRTYELKGWYTSSVGGEPGLETPTMADLCESAQYIVSHSKFDAKMRSDFEASLLERLNSLTRGSKGRMLNTDRSIPVEDLMSKPVVLELDSLNSSEKALVMMFLLTYVYEYCKVKRNSGSKLKHMLLVEEAHNLIASSGGGSENRADPKAHTIELFVNMLAEMRALGEGILIADQLPTAIAPQAVKQTNVKVLMRMTAKDDREEIGNTMDLDDTQLKQCVHFKSGHAYIYHEGEDRVRLVRMLNFKEYHDVEEPPLDSELKVMMSNYEKAHPELYKPFELCQKTCQNCNRRVRDQIEIFTDKLFNDTKDLYDIKYGKDGTLADGMRKKLGLCQVYKILTIEEFDKLRQKYGKVGKEFGSCAYIHYLERAKKEIAGCSKCENCALEKEKYLANFQDYDGYEKYLNVLRKKRG